MSRINPKLRAAATRSDALPPQRSPTRRPRQLPASLAHPSVAPTLPIAEHFDAIVELLRGHQVVVVAGETGSGKTTQLPKACLAAGLGRLGAIAHTQPRRLAARTVAARIAEELGVELGAEVGYAVRFEDRTSPNTVVRLMTDGLLLAELQRDRMLRRYECVIVDEAHERSLNVDFILGCLRRLLPRRPDLKVVVTSATIDVEAFAAYFDDAPVVQVAGRGYPVEVIHLPPSGQFGSHSAPVPGRSAAGAAGGEAEGNLLACLRHIAEQRRTGPRDVLVFQSGEREIFDNAQLLKRAFGERFDILPLYARLPAAEQRRVFAPGRRQRVVLATNVAETSLTVPNIGYVVDPGEARISRYSYRAKLQGLRVEPISQASAAQRAGRCGRVAPGVCYRLYTEADHENRPAYTDPELKRSNLAAVVLAMRANRLGDVAEFPFIDPPDPRAIRDAERLLHELQALEDGKLTAVGRAMARLPVDPRLARMLVAAAEREALAEALIVVSALAAQDPRLRPLDKRAAADRAHARFLGDEDAAASEPPRHRSDFLAFVKLWDWLEAQRAQHSRREFRELLERHFLSPARVREWRALHRQLHLACRDLRLPLNTAPADYATLHTALLAGSLGFIGQRQDPPRTGGRGGKPPPPTYEGARGQNFRIFPGSLLAASPPPWVMAAEVSDTGRPYARCVAAVAPEWIEAVAGHIAKSTFSTPRWDARRGEAVVDERVSVYGLPVVAARRRPAATVPALAAEARELFVLEALVRRPPAGRGRRAEAPVLDANEALLRRLAEQQAHRRRADLLIGEAARCAFYLARLPADVCSVASWQRHMRRGGQKELEALAMTEADLLAGAAEAVRPEDFPTRLQSGDASLALAYKFAPGEVDDGVSLRVSPAQLAALDGNLLDWLVPGFFEEKCVALARALPKTLRRQLAPIGERAREVATALSSAETYRRGPLATALSATMLAKHGVAVPVDAWRLDAVPPHLRLNAQLRQGRRVVDQDRDLAALRGRVAGSTEHSLDAVRERHEQRGLVAFPPEGIPPSVTLADGHLAYPVLVDRGADVDLVLRSSAAGREAQSWPAYARLALLAQPAVVRRLQREVAWDAGLGGTPAPFADGAALADAVLLAAAWEAHFAGEALPVDATGFEARLGRGGLAAAFEATLADLRAILAKRNAVAATLAALEGPAYAPSRADMAAQLVEIAGPDLLATTPSERRPDLLRYLEGMAVRLARLPGRVRQDRDGLAAVEPWQRRLQALREAAPAADFAELRWLLQEFRIATFAQRLGTREKVSGKRLAAAFGAVEAAAKDAR